MHKTPQKECDLKILIVGKEELLRISLEDGLNGRGFEVLSVDSAGKVQKGLKKNYYDILLTDLHTPGLDSSGLLKWIQKEKIKITILIMTTYASIPEAKKGIELGAYDYIIKPFSLEELLLKLDHIQSFKIVVKENIRLKEQAKIRSNPKR